jgi:hypothetical protein
MDMQRRSGLDRGLKDAQGPARGVLRRLQARIVRQPRARRDDISSQEIGHGHMMTPRLVWVWRGGEVPDGQIGDHPDGMGYLQDNPPTLYVISRSGPGQHQTQEAASERR